MNTIAFFWQWEARFSVIRTAGGARRRVRGLLGRSQSVLQPHLKGETWTLNLKPKALHGAFQVLRIIDSPRSRCQGGVFSQWPHATVLAYVFISSANVAYCTMSVSKLVSCCTDTMPISIDWCFSRDHIQHTRIHPI
jgi:hypothetical protein